MSTQCGACGAAIAPGAFVCTFCGAATGTSASTEAEEMQMVRELAAAAQHIAATKKGEGDSHDHVHKLLASFWSMAPLPTQPGALRQACTEALAAINGTRDGDFNLANGQVELLSRAKMCLSILRTMPQQAPVVVGLEAILVEKEALLNPAWFRNPKVWFYTILALVFGGLALGVTLIINQGQSADEIKAGIKTFSGLYNDGGARTLTISDSAISISGSKDGGNTVKLVMEGHTQQNSWTQWDGKTLSFQTRVKSAFSLDDSDHETCNGTLTPQGGTVVVAVGGNTSVCHGFDGTWSKGPATKSRRDNSDKTIYFNAH